MLFIEFANHPMVGGDCIKRSKFLKDYYLERRSLELFNKTPMELDQDQTKLLYQYIYDLIYPKWKNLTIDGIDTGYKISNVGEVLGKRKSILMKDISDTGYYRISGYANGSPIKISIHRAVAEAFIPNPENKPFVNHLNGNKLVNWEGNLEWATHKENMQHAVATGLIDAKGMNHPENVYSDDQVRRACELLENPQNQIDAISMETGINRSILYSIRTGRSWMHISGQYHIPMPRQQLDFDQESLDAAAKLLGSGNVSYAHITKVTGIPYRTLVKILNRSRKYRYLADRYALPDYKRYHRLRNLANSE